MPPKSPAGEQYNTPKTHTGSTDNQCSASCGVETDRHSAPKTTGDEMSLRSKCYMLRCSLRDRDPRLDGGPDPVYWPEDHVSPSEPTSSVVRERGGRDPWNRFMSNAFDPGPGDLEAMWAGMN